MEIFNFNIQYKNNLNKKNKILICNNIESYIRTLLPESKIKSCFIRKNNVIKKESFLKLYTPNVIYNHFAKNSVLTYKKRTLKLKLKNILIFKINPECVCCGIKGNYFALEQINKDLRLSFYHIGDNNKNILMTKDHIFPKSKHGDDSIFNLQTMCSQCNNLKSNYLLSIDSLREIKKYYETNKDKLNKKTFNIKFKKFIEKRSSKSTVNYNIILNNKDIVINKDLIIFKINNEYVVNEVDNLLLNNKRKVIACIKSGTKLKVDKKDEIYYYIKFNNKFLKISKIFT